jgi:hypothetical protein
MIAAMAHATISCDWYGAGGRPCASAKRRIFWLARRSAGSQAYEDANHALVVIDSSTPGDAADRFGFRGSWCAAACNRRTVSASADDHEGNQRELPVRPQQDAEAAS